MFTCKAILAIIVATSAKKVVQKVVGRPGRSMPTTMPTMLPLTTTRTMMIMSTLVASMRTGGGSFSMRTTMFSAMFPPLMSSPSTTIFTNRRFPRRA